MNKTYKNIYIILIIIIICFIIVEIYARDQYINYFFNTNEKDFQKMKIGIDYKISNKNLDWTYKYLPICEFKNDTKCNIDIYSKEELINNEIGHYINNISIRDYEINNSNKCFNIAMIGDSVI